HGGGDVVLRHLELVGQAAVGERRLDRIQILALDVLDERHLEERPLLSRRHVADDDRHALEAGHLRCTPAPLAGDDLKPIADLADDDWLDDAARFDGAREVVEAAVADLAARLEAVRREAIDVDLDWRRPDLGRVRNERAEALPEGGAFRGGHGTPT